MVYNESVYYFYFYNLGNYFKIFYTLSEDLMSGTQEQPSTAAMQREAFKRNRH